MNTVAVSLVTALVGLPCLGLNQDTVRIKWSPVQGTKLVYKMTLHGSESQETEEIEALKDDRVTVVQTHFYGTIAFKDRITFRLDGQCISREMIPTGPGLDTTRPIPPPRPFELLASSRAYYPDKAIKFGDEWDFKSIDTLTKTYDGEARYRYEGLDELGPNFKMHKISKKLFDLSGNRRLVSTTTVWIAQDDGRLYKEVFEYGKDVSTMLLISKS